MTADDRLESLRMKHERLEEMIEEENQRPHPDDFRVADLKKEKLRVKDEIAQIAH